MVIKKAVVKDYLEKLKRTYKEGTESGSATPEMTYRPNISNFFDEIRESPSLIGKSIGFIHEPSSTGKGRPDYKFHNTNDYGVYGYIEVKYISEENLNPWEFEEQIMKYSELETNLILTDGIEFVFFLNAESIKDFSKASKFSLVNSKSDFLRGNSYKIPDLIEDELHSNFTNFFESTSPRHLGKNEFVELLARRANFIKEDAKNLLLKTYHDSSSEKLSNTLKEMYDIFKENLDETLDEESFASLTGQTLIFSLLLAYIELTQSGNLVNVKALQEFLVKEHEKTYKPLAAMTSLISKSPLSHIATGWNDTATLLSKTTTNMDDLLSDFHKLYDLFHGKYDQEERLDFGAYATPRFLADYTVRLTNELAKEHFKKTVFSDGSKLIDPSCGTGTFLESLYEESKKESPGEYEISGIEILPAPYVLSQVRINQFVEKDGNKKKPKVFMGNSLSDEVVKEEYLPFVKEDERSAQLLREEFNGLTEASKFPLMVILGNPPSSDSGFNMGENFTEIESALERFRPPLEDRNSRQNIQKQLQNDFVKFIMWACIKINRTEGGIISFIVPNSALIDKSYVYMREYLQTNFSEIYVLEFDSDLRKTGVTEKNIFATRQGRALLTLIKKPESKIDISKNQFGKILYKSISDKSVNEKKEWLTSAPNLSDYEESNTYGWLKAFKPIIAKSELVEKYTTSFWGLDKIFKNHVSGVKTGCTALVVHSNKNTLMSILEDFSTETISDEVLNKKYFENQAKVGPYRLGWKRAYVAKEIKENLSNRNIVEYDFRPFLKRHVFYSPKVMKVASKDGGRARPELEKIFIDSDFPKKSLAIAKSPSAVSKNLDQFVYVIENLPDNDLASRNNSYIFPMYFPEKSSNLIKENIHSDFIALLNEKFYENKATYIKVAEDLVDYIYAVLSSKVFRETFDQIVYYGLVEGMLRVPITGEKELFFEVAKIGKRLSELQKYNHLDYSGSNVLYEGERNLKLKKVIYQPDNGIIILEDENKNKKGYIKNVPLEVFNYLIKGYNVLKTWFKYQLWGYNHKNFNDESIDEATKFIIGLSLYIKEVSESDEVIEKVLESELIEQQQQ